jgi:hypothetical protein
LTNAGGATPAVGGKMTEKTIQEARVGLEVERTGRLADLTRDPTGNADFLDGSGQAWDVKGFNSAYKNGYDLDRAMTMIDASLAEKEFVILDTSKMIPTHINELRTAIEATSEWAGKIVWSS